MPRSRELYISPHQDALSLAGVLTVRRMLRSIVAPMSMSHVLRVAERIAPTVRRIGLGPVIERSAERFSERLRSTTAAFEGFSIETTEIGHLYYLRDLIDGGHDRYFRELFTEAIPRGGTVLEAGAHIGVMTLSAARAAGATGRVITFEPNNRTLPVLQRNIDRNGFHHRVDVVPRGASSERAMHVFYVSGGETSSLHDPGTASHSITVETVAVDEWLG